MTDVTAPADKTSGVFRFSYRLTGPGWAGQRNLSSAWLGACSPQLNASSTNLARKGTNDSG